MLAPPTDRIERPRGIRTRSAWLVAIPFFLLATPTLAAFAAGAALALAGLALRAWAAGTIRKDEALTTSGPYAHVRHPLYVGSFLVGMGLAAAGGHWVWPALVLAFFVTLYRRTVADEAARLTGLFGHAYVAYAREVPPVRPRLTPYSGPQVETGFTWSRYLRHREWEALLGCAAAFAVLAAKLRWLS